jgi:hypothetical protein
MKPDPDPVLSSTSNKARKTLISTIYDFLSMKTDVNVPSKSNKHKNFEEKIDKKLIYRCHLGSC